MSRLPLLMAILVAFSVPSVSRAQSARYQPKGTGPTTIKYSAPRYRDELMAQIRPGLEWRMGAGTPTTMETEAAWVWNNDVVFPGTYVLAARCETDTEWTLVVRASDGAPQRARRGRGGRGRGVPSQEFPMARTTIEKKARRTDRMALDVGPAKDKARRKVGGSLMRVRFGKHQISTAPEILPIVSKKGKLKEPFELEFVKYHSNERLRKAFDGDGEPVVLARLTLPKTLIAPDADREGNRPRGGQRRPGGRGGRGAAANPKPKPARATLVLIPGETPRIELRGDITRTLTGERKPDQSKTTRLKPTVSKKELTVALGTTKLLFPLAGDTFSKKELGGTTGR